MLIRSQDRTKLVDIAGKTIAIRRINSHINNIEIMYDNSLVLLGSYNEENALKILDLIEDIYCQSNSKYGTFRMPTDENLSKYICNKEYFENTNEE